MQLFKRSKAVTDADALAKPASNEVATVPLDIASADLSARNTAEQSTTVPESFDQFGLGPWLVKTLQQVGYDKPTPVQQHCIPAILRGEDVIGSAETGSGKTAAFALPIVQKLSEDPYGVFALVLTPTRELAVQIAEQFSIFGAKLHIKHVLVLGGMDMMDQAIALSKRPHIVIATPGRLVDHLTGPTSMYLRRLKFLVMDEADRLLEDFAEDVEKIVQVIPARRQTLLFSATLPPPLMEFAKAAPKPPFIYQVSSKLYQTVQTLTQEYMLMPEKIKDCYLIYLLRLYEGKSIIVFGESCNIAAELKEVMVDLDIKATALHGFMSQSLRNASLAAFKSQTVPILIATDIASRGLDIPAVEVVINYDVPVSSQDYVHRVGRTARYGRPGRAITLVTEHDIRLLQEIEKSIGKELTLFEAKDDDILKHLNETTTARTIAHVRLEESGFLQKASELSERRKEKKQQKRARQQELEGAKKPRVGGDGVDSTDTPTTPATNNKKKNGQPNTPNKQETTQENKQEEQQDSKQQTPKNNTNAKKGAVTNAQLSAKFKSLQNFNKAKRRGII